MGSNVDNRSNLLSSTLSNAPARLIGALAVLLLLGQPLLCIVHCRLSVAPAHHSTPTADDPSTFFLCKLPELTVAHETFVPAYWPGLVAVLPVAGAILLLMIRLLAATPTHWPPLTWAPLTPPPR